MKQHRCQLPAIPLLFSTPRTIVVRPTALVPLLASILFSLPALPAAADLTPISQTRSLDFSWSDDEGTYICLPPPTGCAPLDVTHTEDQGDDQAPDFAAWSASLGGIVQFDSSALGPQGFTASASHAGSGIADFFETGEPFEFFSHTRLTISNASVSYTFEVDEPTPYHLTGEIEAGGAGIIGSMLARIRLEGAGGVELLEVELIDDDNCFEPECLDLGPEAVDMSGTLLPGTYTVEATLSGLGEPLISISTGVAAANAYQGSFQIALTVAENVPGPAPLTLALLAAALASAGRKLLGTG